MAAIWWSMSSGTLIGQPQSQPLRLILEAEDFKPVEGDWKVKEYGTNYFASTLAVTFLSRGRYLSAPEQGVRSTAVREIDIPRGGTFEVWARYEQPYDYSVEFDIEIRQGGKRVFHRGYGRREAMKLWPFRKGFQPQVLWDWGGGDNIVWEGRHTRVQLHPGKATIILSKTTQKARQAAKRNIDVIVLTDDEAGVEKQIRTARYLPLDGWLTQQGDVYLQVTNPANNDVAMAVRVGPCTEHSPYWVHVREWPKQWWIGKQDAATPLNPDQYLKPGESSPAVEVGRFFDTLNAFQWKVQVLRADKKPSAGTPVRLKFLVRDKDGHLAPVRDEVFAVEPDNGVTFFLDSDIRRTRRIRTVVEDLEQVARTVASFPKFGRRPEKYLIYGIMGASNVLQRKDRVGELAREIALNLGSNTLPIVDSPQRNGMIDVRHIPTSKLASYCQRLKQEGKAERIKVVSLGDEIHISGAAKSPDDDPAFRQYLKAKGVKASDLGLSSLDDAQLELKDKQSRLYYPSHVFAFERGLERYKERTRILEENLGKDISVGANYSPHPYYWPKEGQWVRAFKRRAMTLPWSEDYVWQVPEASPQIIGYLLAALRCGARDHDLPIHWYVMPHYPGTTPANLRRAYYTAIGHGARQLNFFCATPLSVAYTENYVTSEAKETWRTIHELVHETGMFEHVAFDARPRRADVAFLISFAQDLWDPDPAYNHERKAMYLAHRLAGYAVDFISEEDIQEGKHMDYRTIYIVGNHLERATAQALKKWVHDHGRVLAGIAGGGFRDEYNQPLDTLNEVYGITEQKVERHQRVIMTKQHLPRLKPIDTIRWTDGREATFPALAFKQTFKPTPEAKVFAQYSDGTPAVLHHEYGRGVAMLYGSFVASAYLRDAIPIRPYDRGTMPDSFNHFLPTNFDGYLSDIVTAPAGAGEARWDVITNNPMVESCVLEGPNGLAVVLINWTPQPQRVFLTVQFVPAGRNKVTSIRRGELKATRIKVTVSFRITVDVADVVLIE